jgi:APA family basic amino acid/polyamine antiporter
VPLVWVVAPLAAIACAFIMQGLPTQAWERFGIWLVIGIALYFAYGFSHSKLKTGA